MAALCPPCGAHYNLSRGLSDIATGAAPLPSWATPRPAAPRPAGIAHTSCEGVLGSACGPETTWPTACDYPDPMCCAASQGLGKSCVRVAPTPPLRSSGHGGGGGMLHAILGRQADERTLVVLDSGYVYEGITVRSEKWTRHGWRTASGEVGHRDLREDMLWLREGAGGKLQLRWVPSHLNVPGSDRVGGSKSHEFA